jgi:tetratricopeptide (TPR) repeat protein
MKKSLIGLLIFLLAMGLFSCSHPKDKKDAMLEHVDSIMEEHPDSALTILMHYTMKDFPSVDSRAKYALLLTQADDKNYIDKTNDSIIRIAVQYYDSTREIEYQTRAHYYLGRIHQNMDDQITTAKEFFTALQLIKKTHNNKFIYLIKLNIGYLLWANSLYDESDSIYQLVEHYDIKKHNYKELAIVSMKRGDICIEKANPNYVDAEKYLLRAYSLTKKYGNIYITRGVVSSLSSLYEDSHNPRKAIAFARYGLSLLSDTSSYYGYNQTLGNAFSQMGQYDSANIYLKKSLYCNNQYTKKSAYECLARIARKQGKIKEALQYEERYAAYKDSTSALEHPTEVTAVIKDMLHKQDKEQYESTLSHYTILIVTATLLLLLTAGAFVFNHRRKKRKIEALNKQLQEEEKKQQQINNCMGELLQEHQNKEKQWEEKLAERTMQMEKSKSLKELMQGMPASSRVEECCLHPDTAPKLTEEEWNALTEEVNSVLPDFTTNLSAKYPHLTDSDICFCCLLRMGYTYPQIDNILKISHQAVYQRRKFILQRMGIADKDAKLEELL